MDRNKVNFKLIFWYSIFWIFLFVALYLAYGVYFIDTTTTKSKWVGLFAGSIAMLFGTCKYIENSYISNSDSALRRISKFFSLGTKEFHSKINSFTFLFYVVLSVFLLKITSLGFLVCFIAGTCIAFESIYLFSKIFLNSAVKSIFDRDTYNEIVRLFFNSGVSSIFITLGAIVSAVVILYHIYKDYQVITGFALGYVLLILIHTTCYTLTKKSTDASNDIVTAFNQDITETDKRNPSLLLRGLTKGIFSSYSASIDTLSSFCAVFILAIAVGALCMNLMGAFFAIIIVANALFSSIISAVFVRISKLSSFCKTFMLSDVILVILFSGITLYTVKIWLPDFMGLAYSAIIGAVLGLLICAFNLKSVLFKSNLENNISNILITGVKNTIIATIKESCFSLFLPCIVVAILILASFLISSGIDAPMLGIWGIVISILSTVSTVAVVLVMNIFASSMSNIETISTSYEFENQNEVDFENANEIACKISILINNSINFVSVLSLICIIIAYCVVAAIDEIDLINPFVLTSIIIGLMIPILYTAYSIGSIFIISKNTSFEIKRQFKKTPEIIEYDNRPDFERLVSIASNSAIIRTAVILSIIFVAFFVFYVLFKSQLIAAFLFAMLISSIGIVIISSNGSLIIKRVKNYYENTFDDKKGSFEHQVVGATNDIFSFFEDFIGPILIPLIKFLSVLAVAILPIL